MKIAVIIPNLHSPVIDRVVKAVLAQADLSPEVEVKVWVVGQDRYGKVPTSSRVHTIVTSEPLYPGAARNLGARYAVADAFIFLDADCIPQSGWLTELLRTWQVHSDAGAISGAMLPQSETFMMHCGQIACFHEFLTTHPPGERATLASFSLLIPYEVWKSSGEFNPNLWSMEDMELSLRLRVQGWKLYFTPYARVYHCPVRTTWRSLWSHGYRRGTYSIGVRLQHSWHYRMPRWSRWAFAWLALAPLVAVARTAQIYITTPGLWRYLYCAPWVFLHKLAWCYGAAHGLRHPIKGVVV